MGPGQWGVSGNIFGPLFFGPLPNPQDQKGLGRPVSEEWQDLQGGLPGSHSRHLSVFRRRTGHDSCLGGCRVSLQPIVKHVQLSGVDERHLLRWQKHRISRDASRYPSRYPVYVNTPRKPPSHALEEGRGSRTHGQYEGHCTKAPQTGRLHPQTSPHRPAAWRSMIKVSTGLAPSEGCEGSICPGLSLWLVDGQVSARAFVSVSKFLLLYQSYWIRVPPHDCYLMASVKTLLPSKVAH